MTGAAQRWTIASVTGKQKAILSGAWKNAVGTFCGVFVAVGGLQGARTWADIKSTFVITLPIAAGATVASEFRYWLNWYKTSETTAL